MKKITTYLNNLKKKPKKLVFYIVLIIFALTFILLKTGIFNHLELTTYTYTSDKLPEAFDGYNIVQISDLHVKFFGKDNCELIDKVKSCNPDIIAITGDLLNDDLDDLSSLYPFLDELSSIAPTYFICGNHDMPTWQEYLSLVQLLYQYNIVTIDNQTVELSKDNESIYLSGLFSYTESSSINISQDNFNILLYHYANHFDNIKQLGFDLIITGHTHGGIIRLPYIGGLIGTEFNFFPKYDGGIDFDDSTKTTMITSRGLGEAFIPRFNNNPELVSITLKKGNNINTIQTK
ncbi:MAG: metallophosphoesterase [Lachnospiraceae bacterium]|nr:metallophosphoesterase [Lachnospiraceae bacterium]